MAAANRYARVLLLFRYLLYGSRVVADTFAQSKSWSFLFRCSVLNKTKLLSEGITACLALHSPHYLVSMLVSLIIVIICY